jgi:hypothetical protein
VFSEDQPLNANYDPNRLLDWAIERLSLESDRDLCAALEIVDEHLVGIRKGVNRLPASILIAINDLTRCRISELKKILGDRRAKQRLVMTYRRSSWASPAGGA